MDELRALGIKGAPADYGQESAHIISPNTATPSPNTTTPSVSDMKK